MNSLPPSYLARCRATGRNPITADYAVWLLLRKGLRPAVVPADFTEFHLSVIPARERRRWLMTAARRGTLAQKRRAA